MNTRHGVLSTRLYRDASGAVGMSLWTGDLAEPQAVSSRLHSSCFTSEALGGLDCDCVAQLDVAIASIVKAGRGVVFYLLQEGRSAGLSNKARDRSMVQKSAGSIDTYGAYKLLGLSPDPRRYDIIKPMCIDLGIVAPLNLMTNNPAKIRALADIGLNVAPVKHVQPPSRFNGQYIAAKARFGHLIPSPELVDELPPSERNRDFAAGTRLGRFVLAASYLLPIEVDGQATWFRATSYVDDISGHDRMLLSLVGRAGVAEIRHIYRDDLAARILGDGEDMARYHAALVRIVEHGAGSVLTVPADPGVLLAPQNAPTEEDDLNLLHADGSLRGAETYEEVA